MEIGEGSMLGEVGDSRVVEQGWRIDIYKIQHAINDLTKSAVF